MDPLAHRRFTEALAARLAADPRVVGLVAQGSTAAAGRAPDAWSDHDVFVVVTPGAAEALRRDTSWLPAPERIVLHVRETAHGCKVLWDDGHLAEYAVFEGDELRLARSESAFEVLFDRGADGGPGGGVTATMGDVVHATAAALAAPFDAPRACGLVVTTLLVAAGRWRRGEHLSARSLMNAAVVHHLVPLFAHLAAPDAPATIDATRRFETRHPALAAALDAAQRQDVDAGALALLDLLEREAGGRVAGFPAAGLAAVRTSLERVP